MLKTLFSIMLILAAVTVTGNAANFVDDPNTFYLYHADSVSSDGSTAYDDTSVTGRTPANDLGLKWKPTVYVNAPGYTDTGADDPAGKSLDFGTTQNVGAMTTYGAAALRRQVKADGWFWFPAGPAKLPIQSTVGGTQAAEGYLWQVSSNGGDSGIIAALHYNTTGGTGGSPTLARDSVRLRWRCFPTTSTTSPDGVTDGKGTIFLQFYNTGLGINRTGKWIRITGTYCRDADSSDPNFNRSTLTIYDPQAGVTDSNYINVGSNINDSSGRKAYFGWGKSNTPLRNFAGRMDELQMRDRIDATPEAYAPTPANGGVASPTANLTLQWIKGTPRYPGDSVTQTLRYGTEPNMYHPSTQVFTPSGTTQDVGTVVLGGTYYWQVFTYDPGRDVTTPSKAFSFTVDDVPPVIEMGDDKITWLQSGSATVSLTPTVTDTDTAPENLTYAWTKVGGGAANISSPNTKDTDVTVTQAGSYIFLLTVSDLSTTVSKATGVRVYATVCEASQNTAGFGFKTTDFNEDCTQNFNDFASMAANWAECNSLDPACL